jgi:hypothetical protein
MLWYRLWLDTGERQYLDDSILYNEDDCRATHMIKQWMAGEPQVETAFPPPPPLGRLRRGQEDIQ